MGINLSERLTPHFTIGELTASQHAARNSIVNVPTAEQLYALRLLCIEILEPVRAHFGAPVLVSSGFRCERLNRGIGGSATSQHCKGEAADFTVAGVSNRVVCEWIAANRRFDQLIYEFGESGWVHCSYRPAIRKQVLSAKKVGRRTKYLPGLIA